MKPVADPTAEMTTGFFLVDVCNFPMELDCEPFDMVRCVPAALTNIQDLMPSLVAVETLSEMQLKEIIEIFRQQAAGQHPFAICAWLDCQLAIEELALHIAGFLCGPGPDGTDVLFRYFDPRVFSTAIGLFTESQCETLLGPIKRWCFTWCRNWWLVVRKGHEVDCLLGYQAGWPTTDQWLNILQSKVLNRVLTNLATDTELPPDQYLHSQTSALAYLRDAQLTLGLEDEDDQFEFAFLCTKYGEAYRRHPKLVDLWIALQQQKISWTVLHLKLNAADFERLNMVLYAETGNAK